MFSFISVVLAASTSLIRWEGVEQPDAKSRYAVVQVEGAKPGDKIYLMENENPEKAYNWVPKHYYVLEEANGNQFKLLLPECQSNKSYALALEDQNGRPGQQPSYSRPFTFNEMAPRREDQWVPSNGRFDSNADAASIAAGTRPNGNGNGAKNEKNGGSGSKSGKSSKTTKKSKNSSMAVFGTFTAMLVILGSMLM